MRKTGTTCMLSFIRPFVLITCIILLAFSATSARQSLTDKWLKFADRETQAEAGQENNDWWIKTRGPIPPQQMKEAGLELLRKLDDQHFIVRANQATLIYQGDIANYYPARPEWKLSPSLLESHKSVAPYSVDSYILRVSDIEAFKLALSNLVPEARILHTYEPSGTVVISTTSVSLLEKVLTLPSVRFADKQTVSPVEEASVIDLNLIPNRVNAVWSAYPELTGRDILISVKERAFTDSDIDLTGRSVESGVEASQTSPHATEMATIIGGAGNSFIKGKGVVWQTNLTSSNFEPTLPDAEALYETLGITIQNHSYGTEIEHYYGAEAEAFDASVIATPELVHVFSSGNSGTIEVTAGTYAGIPGFANLTGELKMAKNILTVGAVDLEYIPQELVSRGPAYDGRVKPELVAYSTFGSSNSAAIVSGVAAMVQQTAIDMGQSVPSSDLVRAYLINSAIDVHTPQVDYLTGYGNVNALRAVEEYRKSMNLQASVTDGSMVSETVMIPAGATNLKISLVWNDPPALPNANVAIVNDLDLKVIKDGETWLPWTLNHTPDADALAQPATRGADHLNTIEQVTIEAPEAGSYTISVSGYDVPKGPQAFSVVYQYDEAGRFQWTNPTLQDNFPYDGESPSYFRWDTNLTGSATIEMSFDDGATWETVATDVNLSDGFYQVERPEGHGKATARLTTAYGDIFTTDTFTIGDVLNTRVGFNCADSVMLRWENLPEAEAYRVLSAQGTFLDTVTVTADTAIILYKPNYDTRKFAIQPIYEGGKGGLKTSAFDYAFQGVECFVVNLIPRSLPEQGIELTLNLGTSYGVQGVTFSQQNYDANIEPLGTVNSVQGDSVVFLDDAPLPGPNLYTATIRFQNGETLTAGPVLSYYISDIEVLVFPNPVQRGAELSIYTKEFEGEYGSVSVFNTQGQLMYKEPIISTVKIVPTERFTPGLYLYKVEVAGTVKTGRVLIQ
ncbi:S8 family serine peptidase [Roseivirga sp. BDSF3-8]|uniref:S8 family serine peptidase n=1 Tax=Roseivirga sp. BDSF3-8 TaxID=3241598 RepID=UPI00353244DA